MQVNVEKLSPVLVEFQIEVPAAQVRSEVDKAYVVLQRSAKVKGFRPGKAPRQVLAHLYGGRIHADVAQRLVDSTLNQALSDKQVQPLSQPAIAPSELKPEEAFSYKARFEVRPEIDVVNWEGFAVTRPSVIATEAAIDAEIVRLRREHSTLQTPDPERPAKTTFEIFRRAEKSGYRVSVCRRPRPRADSAARATSRPRRSRPRPPRLAARRFRGSHGCWARLSSRASPTSTPATSRAT